MNLQERPVFLRMVDADDAAQEAERLLSEILGVELLSISFDPYDSSFEIYPVREVADITIDDEQHAAILALGCDRYWINFADGTERYCQSNRKPSASKRWDANNTFKERKRREEAELDRLQARVAELEPDAERYRWLRHGDNDEYVLRFSDGRPVPIMSVKDPPPCFLLREGELDAAIDTARKAKPQGSGT